MELNPNLAWLSSCFTFIVVVGIAFYLPVKCSANEQQNKTLRVQAACSGDLKTDPARAIACAMAIRNANSHVGQ